MVVMEVLQIFNSTYRNNDHKFSGFINYIPKKYHLPFGN